MDDEEHREENNQGASTSKENKERKDDEKYDERDRDHRHHQRRDRDDRSYSDTESECSEHARSRVDLRKDGRPDQTRQPNKRDGKVPERKKRNIRRGRVVKRRRRRSTTRRYEPLRRAATAAKRRSQAEKCDSNASVSTTLSSRSGSVGRGCTYCGHRCCGRRCSSDERRTMRRLYVRKITKKLRKKRLKESRGKKSKKSTTKGKSSSRKRQSGLEGIQAGSRSKMLSPLFLNTNADLKDDIEPANYFVEITPEMIYEALRYLTMWRQAVSFELILQNIKINYPVNPNNKELSAELAEKLRVATIAGIITEIVTMEGDTKWLLSDELLDRGLDKNHVTMFWEVYGDTMTPIGDRILSPSNQTRSMRDKRTSGSEVFGPNTII